MTTAIDVLRFKDGGAIHPQWKHESLHWRGVILRGWLAHYCNDWDGLPVDETTSEFSCCTCYS